MLIKNWIEVTLGPYYSTLLGPPTMLDDPVRAGLDGLISCTYHRFAIFFHHYLQTEPVAGEPFRGRVTQHFLYLSAHESGFECLCLSVNARFPHYPGNVRHNFL